MIKPKLSNVSYEEHNVFKRLKKWLLYYQKTAKMFVVLPKNEMMVVALPKPVTSFQSFHKLFDYSIWFNLTV
jgi:hypothetical protein